MSERGFYLFVGSNRPQNNSSTEKPGRQKEACYFTIHVGEGGTKAMISFCSGLRFGLGVGLLSNSETVAITRVFTNLGIPHCVYVLWGHFVDSHVYLFVH